MQCAGTQEDVHQKKKRKKKYVSMYSFYAKHRALQCVNYDWVFTYLDCF